MPDPYMKVYLSVLGISSRILYLIREFFEKCSYEPSEVELVKGPSPFKAYQDTEEYAWVDKIDEEELLLLTLASHKLHIKALQPFINAKIASLVSFDDYETASKEFGLDITDDEHLNNYLKSESKWAGIYQV